MKLSAADIDWTKLSDDERWTLENVVISDPDQVAPRVQDGWDVAEIAAKLDRDPDELQEAIDTLAAHLIALSGLVQLPPHTPEEYDALKASVKTDGQQAPILRGSPSSGMPGEIVDGETRLRICRELKIEPWIKDIDGSADQLRSLGLAVNLARRMVNASSRRRIVKAELLRDPTRSDRAIANDAGVSPTTVGTVRRELEQRGTVSRLDTRTGRDGVAQPSRRSSPPPRPDDGNRSIRLTVARELFDELVGSWIVCDSFRLVERRPGVYELEIRRGDTTPATSEQLQAFDTAASSLADALGSSIADVTDELLENAGEIFGRSIAGVTTLTANEAAWATKRMLEIASHAR